VTRASISLAVLVGAAVGAASAARPAGDPDIYWHLATARDALAHGLVRADLFSWTIAGASVSTDQWLGQLLFFAAYSADAWSGVVLLRALAVAAIVGLTFANASLASRHERPLVALLATVPAILLSRYVWSERPELLGVACFAGLLPLLRLGRSGSDRALALTVPLLWFWANVHGSFALGVVLVVLASFEGAWRDRPRRSRYAIAALAAIVVTLVTPAGFGSWTAPGFHLLNPPRELQEWAVPDVRNGIGSLFGVTLAVVVAVALFARPLELREVIVLLPLLLLALTAVRQTPLFAIAAAPFLATRTGDALAALLALARVKLTLSRPPSRPARGLAAISFAASAVFVVAAFVIAPPRPDESLYPVDVLAALPTGSGLFNNYDWGGWLIWHAPATPVFIDGRYTPYRCCGVLDDYQTVVGAEPGWREVVARRGVRSILVRPADPIATRGIESGWTVLARAPGFVLLRIP
jgi:hypothetical protein